MCFVGCTDKDQQKRIDELEKRISEQDAKIARQKSQTERQRASDKAQAEQQRASDRTAAAFEGRAPTKTDIFTEGNQGSTITFSCWIRMSIKVPTL